MSIRTSIARIGPGGQVWLSDGSRHDDAEAAIRAVLRTVEAGTAPAGAVVTIAFVRPAGVLIANAACEDVDYAFVRGLPLCEVERLVARLHAAPTAH